MPLRSGIFHTHLGEATMAERARNARSGAFAPESRGADDGIRTRDPHLGKVVLYQLSYVRAER
jgi:hypothetical protein